MVDLHSAAPAHELLGQRVLQGDRGVRQAEEAGQGIAVQLGEFRAGNPLQEGLGCFGVLGGGVHAQGDVGMVADVALSPALGTGGLKMPIGNVSFLLEDAEISQEPVG